VGRRRRARRPESGHACCSDQSAEFLFATDIGRRRRVNDLLVISPDESPEGGLARDLASRAAGLDPTGVLAHQGSCRSLARDLDIHSTAFHIAGVAADHAADVAVAFDDARDRAVEDLAQIVPGQDPHISCSGYLGVYQMEVSHGSVVSDR